MEFCPELLVYFSDKNDERFARYAVGWLVGQVVSQAGGWSGGWMVGRFGAQAGGWLGGWVGGWMVLRVGGQLGGRVGGKFSIPWAIFYRKSFL